MERFFTPAYTGPAFVILGPPHVVALVALIVFNVVLFQFKYASKAGRISSRWLLALILWTAEAAWHVWNIKFDRWSLQSMLPLNLCSIFIWLCGLMLVIRSFQIYEFAYFLGIGGAIQYLITPDLGIYGFPHFRFFQTFISHGFLLTAPIYMSVVEGFRPSWKSILRVVIWTNLYMAVVFFVNLALGSNYLMLNSKPATPSLLDLLPSWPYYVFYMELIGLLTCLILFLPFAFTDRNRLSHQPSPYT